MRRTICTVALAWAFGTVLAGCAGTVKGEVDGEKPPTMKSGFWYYQYDETDGVIVGVALSSVGGWCDRATELLRAQTAVYEDYFAGELDDDEASDALAELSEEHLPSEFWEAGAAFLADDQDELEDDAYDIGGDAPTAAFALCHHDGYIDWLGLFLEGDASGTETRCYSAVDGEAEITAFKDEGRIRGRGEAELVDEEGDDAGEVEFSFSVTYCEAYEEALEDLYDVLYTTG